MTDTRYRVENPEVGVNAREAARTASDWPSELHVPEAPHRPGDEPRFSRFTQQPGDLDRPECLADYRRLRAHADGLIRVLCDEGDALGPWNPQLTPATLRKGLEVMVRSRVIDARLFKMQRQGRLTFYVGCEGEEAVGVAGAMAFRREDLLFPAYRQLGLFLVRGMSPVQMMCQCIGNPQDNCEGRQMPVHYSWRKGNVVSMSSPVGTQFPQAVGAAMATAFRGEHNVTASWIGEGTAAQGDFHHAVNFASTYLPPVVLNVVNNQWAISTHRNIATGGKSFAARAEAYGLPGLRVDGNDFLAVYAATRWAADRARKGGGPTLIELLTYRSGAHSSSDDPSRYRPRDEGRLWPGGDPIERVARHLIQLGAWSSEKQLEMIARVEQETVEAFKEAESYGSLSDGPLGDPRSLIDHVYRQPPWHLERQQKEIEQRDSA